jgi:Mn2+/Fe2+ NRAMP family transporter
MLGMLFFGSYHAIERVLKYVLLVFVAYIAAAFFAHPNWGSVLHATVIPFAGPIAGYLFAIGLLASAILAVPVLASTSAYMLAQEFGWRQGLSSNIRRAWRFTVARVSVPDQGRPQRPVQGFRGSGTPPQAWV